jgi:hypothetical protein
MTNSEKVHLLCYAHPSSLRRMDVRLTPQDSQALHLELFPNSANPELREIE